MKMTLSMPGTISNIVDVRRATRFSVVSNCSTRRPYLRNRRKRYCSPGYAIPIHSSLSLPGSPTMSPRNTAAVHSTTARTASLLAPRP